jgi:hypothetical protein
MSTVSYEIFYLPFWARVDVSQMILEYSNGKYENVYNPLKGQVKIF